MSEPKRQETPPDAFGYWRQNGAVWWSIGSSDDIDFMPIYHHPGDIWEGPFPFPSLPQSE